MSNLTFEDEIEAHLTFAYSAAFGKQPTEDWFRAICMRVGTTGTVSTLDAAGDAIGVTRERVRQVVEKIAKYLHGVEVTLALPIAQEIVQHSPVVEPIGSVLNRAGLSRPTLTGPAFLNLLKLVGTSPRELVGTDLISINDWLVEESEVPIMGAINMASKHTSSFGMTTVEEIRQALAAKGNALDIGDIRRVLEFQDSIKWAGDWLWVEKDDNLHSNRLVNVARSILSVNTPQTIASIYEGARRMWKFRRLDVLAPVSAMTTFFQESSFFVVNGDLIDSSEPLDYHEILGATTSTMIDVLKASPYEVMDRRSLNEACKDAGIASGTYGIWTTYAEWMERFGKNVWGLRGSKPNPAAIAEIQRAAEARAKAEPRRKSWTWMKNGRIVQTMDVTTSFISSGVLSFVPEIQKVLAGTSLRVFSEPKELTIVKLGDNHSFCWGWHPAIKAIGAKQGDVLRIEVDMSAKAAYLQLGGEELWA